MNKRCPNPLPAHGTRRHIAWAAALLACVLLASCDRAKHGDEEGAAEGAPKATTSTSREAERAGADEVRLSKEAAEENEVEVSPVGKRVLVPTFPAPARVAFDAEAMARVGAPVAGRVAELKARLGDSVRKDDELLAVESPDLGEAQSDYLQKRTAAAAATAAVEPAKIAYERGRSLQEQSQGVSLAEVQKREADYRAAQAAAQAAGGAANGAQNKLHLMGMSQDAVRELEATAELTPRYSIRSPIAGDVVQFDPTVGALVGPDKDLGVEVADVAKVWVFADVPEADSARLAKGAAVRVTVAALPGRTFDGKVTLVAPALDPATRTVQARVEVKNAEGVLRPGMLARADIEAPAADRTPVVAVPDDAVVTFEGHAVVFVPVEGEAAEGDEHAFRKREVKAGAPVGGWTSIVAGLNEGEKVVTRGAVILKAQLAKPPEEEE